MTSSRRVRGGSGGGNSKVRTPVWVRVLGIAVALFIALVVVLHLSGRGMGDHGLVGPGMGDHGVPADTQR
jgi:hypothetical protein